MPPEYIDNHIISKKSDVFSLGVIIIEIIAGERKYPDDTVTHTSAFTKVPKEVLFQFNIQLYINIINISLHCNLIGRGQMEGTLANYNERQIIARSVLSPSKDVH